MKRLGSLVGILALLAPTFAFADDCKGVLLSSIPDHPEYGKAGEIVEMLHEYEGKPDGTPLTYAVHGGGIYPADRVKILNCTISKTTSDPYYKLTLNDTAENAYDILYQKTTEKLLALGLCNACASGVAEEYLKKPNGACGIMAARALHGDTSAVDFLNDGSVCR
ncbi:hypothetical protein [Asaia prunellae]|uniref:hypothetical protein n=1 Tax=Asaia prunellae TaxID=610245 RepID=UPI0004705814|nr:hypothetical protein [Asaia prunellae]